MKKRMTAAALAATMSAALLLTACGGSGGSASTSDSGSSATGDAAGTGGEVEEIVFASWTINSPPTEEGLQAVEDAINEITIPEIGVKVDYQLYPIAEYSQKVALELQSGGTIDLFCCASNFQSNLSDDMFYDITELVDECLPDVKELLPEDWWEGVTYQGQVVAVPVWLPSAAYINFAYRSDIAEELGLDMESVKSVEDLTGIFEQVHAAYPDMYCLIGGNAGFGGIAATTYSIPNVDTMGDSTYMPAGVLMGDSDTVVNLFETEEYAERMALVRSWYEAGYIMQDLATTTLTNIDLFAAGNSFGQITGQGSHPDYVGTNATNQTGYPIKTIMLSEASIGESSLVNQCFSVASTSEHPEAALKFLNMTYCNADIANLIAWGIEGRDYVVNEDGTVQPPEGFDSASVPYPGGYMNYGSMYCGLEYPAVGTSLESIEFGVENNYNAKRARSFGFVFDQSPVATQYAAVNNVIMQYYPSLDCGSVDPETTIPEFNQALKDAGIDDIIAEKQAQYDAWRASREG